MCSRRRSIILSNLSVSIIPKLGDSCPGTQGKMMIHEIKGMPWARRRSYNHVGPGAKLLFWTFLNHLPKDLAASHKDQGGAHVETVQNGMLL